jgi:hypothetical protein
VPKNYPEVDTGIRSKQDWFDRLVDWWQLQTPNMSTTLPFTHGNRIYKQVDQIQNVIKLLEQNPNSSRAVVTLHRPDQDEISDRSKKFPSFCMAQFVVRRSTAADSVLDCLGFFRKQEMKYWWPVNVAELRLMQKKVFDGLPRRDELENLKLGSLTTFASMARIGTRAPQVAVPILDQNFQQDPGLLWSMCYALFWRAKAKKKYLPEWKSVLKELVPSGKFDPDGVPVPLEGLKFLYESVIRFEEHHSNQVAKSLVNSLKEILERNERFAEASKNEDQARSEYYEWVKDVTASVEKLSAAVHKLMGG